MSEEFKARLMTANEIEQLMYPLLQEDLEKAELGLQSAESDNEKQYWQTLVNELRTELHAMEINIFKMKYGGKLPQTQ